MALSTHFYRHEFACRCGCGFDTVDIETLAVLEEVRMYFAAPVIINSGCRCPEHNARIGGAPGSQHLLGRAADIRVQGIKSGTVYDWLATHYPGVSLGRYATFTHVDTRSSGPARW